MSSVKFELWFTNEKDHNTIVTTMNCLVPSYYEYSSKSGYYDWIFNYGQMYL